MSIALRATKNKTGMDANMVSLDDKVQEWLDWTAKTVGSTLGPHGSTVFIEFRPGMHYATKDGYMVLRMIHAGGDPVGSLVLNMLRDLARRLVRRTGDGTTSSIIAAAGLHRGFRRILRKHGGLPPREGLEVLRRAADMVEAKIREKHCWEVGSGSRNLLWKVADISANGDKALADKVASMLDQVGHDGIARIERSWTGNTSWKLNKGFSLLRGLPGPQFATETDVKGYRAEFDETAVLLCDGRIGREDNAGLSRVLKTVFESTGQSLVVVAGKFDEAIANWAAKAMEDQRQKIGKPTFTLLEYSSETTDQYQRLLDLGVWLGARVYRKRTAGETEKDGLFTEALGHCEGFHADESTTRFMEGGGDPAAVEAHAEKLRGELAKLEEDEEDEDAFRERGKEQLRNRLAGLSDRVAVLRVGGDSEQETEMLHHAAEDAVFACKSALREGVVVGGNTAAARAAADLLKTESGLSGLEREMLSMIEKVFTNIYYSIVQTGVSNRRKAKRIVARTLAGKNRVWNAAKGVEQEFGTDCEVVNPVETDLEVLRGSVSLMGMLAIADHLARQPSEWRGRR